MKDKPGVFEWVTFVIFIVLEIALDFYIDQNTNE